jgi:molybdopterin-containing oxidoreductase family iron-sulfur binding subunit
MTDPKETARYLAGLSGPRYWRGLEEMVESDAFAEYLRREFPDDADRWTDPVTRRQFLMLMGASLALAGVSGCSTQPAPRDRILPYVRQPEAITPGRPLFFATAMPLAGDAIGLLVESHEGRPTKIEGNPQHPASHGATDVLSQASILGLYDPDRSQSVTYRGQPRSWDEAVAVLRGTMDRLAPKRGAGLRILSGAIASPTLLAQMREFLDSSHFPEAKWIQYEPLDQEGARGGARLAFGEVVQTTYDFAEADVIVALDADFLHCSPAGVRYSWQFSNRRRVRTRDHPVSEATMCRLYAVESMLTNTGATADHRLALRASQVEHFARALARALGVPEAPPPGNLPDLAQRWIEPLTADLRAEGRRRRCPVVVGERQPPRVHALVHAINETLGNAGTSVLYTDPVAPAAGSLTQLRDLAEEMQSGKVDVLVILGANPVYDAPAGVDFAAALAHVRLRVHLGVYQDETAVQCDWHIPEGHYLESWGDCRSLDGTASIIQPLIEPLYGGHSAHELVATLTSAAARFGHEIVRNHWRGVWRERGESGEFEDFWQTALQEGVIPETAQPRRSLRMKAGWAGRARGEPSGETPGQVVQEVVFYPDSALYDGRFANNGWLQELPRPITKLTWDNAIVLSPQTAKDLGLSTPTPGPNGGEHGQAEAEVVELQLPDLPALRAAVWVQPGHADGSITLHLGHGRTKAGHTGNGVGFNAYPLRTIAAPWIVAGLRIEVRKTDEKHTLACTQMHHRMEGRRPVRGGTLDDYKHQRDFAARVTAPEPTPPAEDHDHHDHPAEPKDRRLVPLDLYAGATPPDAKGHRWGMVIDLTACTGCSACVVACQAENNIPVVGKEQVIRGREMHWLRIDRYFSGDADDAAHLQTHFQPVPCMHCERAPCELVCPVNATVHSHDGLNDMVYNRCVGTRYCSNNCPYKVRRFNFLQYANYHTPSLKMMRNPEVTVRSRGVMEKCTYCVQRIRHAGIVEQERLTPLLAALERRRQEGAISDADAAEEEAELRHQHRITEHDLMTACQSACPTQAIVFGNLDDPESRVRRWHDEPLDYGLLAELNTKPRTTYLAALKNPNPRMP